MVPVGGVAGLGVLGLELGLEVAGVAKGVFEVEVMILDALSPALGTNRVRAFNADEVLGSR